MVRKEIHYPCQEQNCLSYTAYIRIKQKWIPVGIYSTKCQTFVVSKPIVKVSPDQGIRDFMSKL